MNQQQQQIIAKCEAEKTLFEDPDFPPNQKSLGKPLTCIWLRPTEFIEETTTTTTPIQLFYDGISSSDIVQGGLGDCYFLSSLSVLADSASWCIKDLFKDNIQNKVGCYAITFHLDGAIKTVIIDDLIPCDKATRKPIFSRNKGNELWVLLLEKAYAKCYGSYRAIESGVPGDALSDLTGAPIHVLRTSDMSSDSFWSKLSSYHQMGYIIAAGIPNVPSMDLQKEVGLIEGHAYGLLDVNEQGDKIVKIRNPWGKVEWKGAWSDNDRAHWTDELKAKLGWNNSNDGTFWMSVQDFKKYFDQVTVLLLDKSWIFNSCPCELNVARASFDLISETSADIKSNEVFLTMNQKRGKTTVSMRLCVLKEDSSQTPIGGTSEVFVGSETISSKKLILENGMKYRVLCEVFEDQSRSLPIPFSLSCYSKHPGIKIQLIGKAPVQLEFVLPEFAEKFGSCSLCNNPLAGSFYTISGKKYHQHCFHCSNCNGDISGGFLMKQGKFVCKKCSNGSRPPSGDPSTSTTTTTTTKKPASIKPKTTQKTAVTTKPKPKPTSTPAIKTESITVTTKPKPKPTPTTKTESITVKKKPTLATPSTTAPTSSVKKKLTSHPSTSKKSKTPSPPLDEEQIAILIEKTADAQTNKH